jgi:streptogramin lyase
MKQFFISYFLFLISNSAIAHPGTGLVKNSKGEIIYSDLSQIWKLNADGSKTTIVPHVHSHELFMNDKDDLFGEHLWFNGEKLNTWGSYAWRLNTKQKLDTVVPVHEGYLDYYSFTRDSKGNMYYAERGSISRIIKQTPGGKKIVLAEKDFLDIRKIHVTPDGEVYFIDLIHLYKIDKSGKLVNIARKICSNTPLFTWAYPRHSLFGIWLDKQQHIYVANFSGQVVKKITPDGKVSDYYFSTGHWAPTAGLFDEAGNLWLQEYNITNEVRVRKIMKTTLSKPNATKAYWMNRFIPYAILILVVSLLLLLSVRFMKLKRRKIQPV